MKKLTQDLKVVTRELKKLTKKVESLSTRAIKLEKKQVEKETAVPLASKILLMIVTLSAVEPLIPVVLL